MARKSNVERVAKYKGLVNGIKKRWSSSGTRIILNENYSSSEVVDRLQSMIDAIQETSQAYAGWRDRLSKQRELEKSLREFVRYIDEAVRTEVGNNAELLAIFGLQPAKKTGPRATKTKLAMVQKARATRVMRKTMGRRQRQKIQGKG
jgi:hypothetical protein